MKDSLHPARHTARWLGCFIGITTASWLSPPPAAAQSTKPGGDDEPPALTTAREAHELQFVREVGVLQDKYRGALEQYQRNLTRSGQLEAAMEAEREIRLAKYWKTVPLPGKERSLKNPELNSLLHNYQRAVRQTVEPITDRYLRELDRLKVGVAKSGDLTAPVKIEAEINRIKPGTALPIEAGVRDYFEGFSKNEFHAWLQENTFQFSGAAAGDTKLTFTGDTMHYDSATALAPTTFTYKLTSSRSLVTNESGFSIQFAKDLSSGVFTSSRGDYELRLVTPPETEPTE